MCLGKTHALAGATIGGAWSEFVQHGPPLHTAAFAVLTGALALWPDVDQCGSTVSRSLGFFSGIVARFIRKASGGHRHSTHAVAGILATAGLARLSCMFLPAWPADVFLAVILTFSVAGFLECLGILRGHWSDAAAIVVSAAVIWRGYGLAMIPLAVLIGCSAHVLLDLMTDAGVMLAYPFSKRKFHLLPEPLAFTTGTRPETRFVVPVTFAALAALAVTAAFPSAWTVLAGALR